MATTHDATALFPGQSPVYGGAGMGFGAFNVLKLHVDMEEISDELNATIDGSATDVVELWDIPQGCHINSVLMDVTTVEGATATVAVGDGTSTAGFMAATSINALTTTTMGGTIITDAFGAVGGKLYLATDTLDLLFATAADIDAAVFDLYLMCCFMLPVNTVYTPGS